MKNILFFTLFCCAGYVHAQTEIEDYLYNTTQSDNFPEAVGSDDIYPTKDELVQTLESLEKQLSAAQKRYKIFKKQSENPTSETQKRDAVVQVNILSKFIPELENEITDIKRKLNKWYK